MIDNILKEIEELYVSDNSIRSISIKTKKSTTFISDHLKKVGLFVNNNKQKYNPDLNRFKTEDEYEFKIVCKKTEKVFKDYTNKSGVLTNHLLELYPDIVLMSPFKRREQLRRTGVYWFEEFFTIKKFKKEEFERKQCKYCDWTTVDVQNKSGWYSTHLKKEHNISIEQYVEEFPEEKELFSTYLQKYELRKFIESDKKNHIECKLCNKKFLKITNSHLLHKHGISLEEYKMEYSTNTLSKKTLEVQREIYEKGLRLYEPKFTSKGHTEIIDLLNSYNIQFSVNDKKVLNGVELDIYIPDKKIAIEYNGLYYHSEVTGKKKRSFHLSKTKLCEKEGIQLLHIFEDEWLLKKEIVISKIKHIININDSDIIHARKCEIKESTKQEKDNFLEKNHIQGADNSNLCIGAYYEDKLVAVMTFDNKRNMVVNHKNNSLDYELKRFSSDINYRISGISSRLIKYFIKQYSPNKIISFADRCWSTNSLDNSLYIKLGFYLNKTLGPDYKYFNPKIARNKRLHKFSFGKSSLKIKFKDIYSDKKTEWEMMQEMGYDRIWDCGKFKFVLDLL